MNWTLDNLGADGFFGPKALARAGDGQDWWGRMPMYYALRDHYEATHDERVIHALTKWFHLRGATIANNPPTHWGRARIGDTLDCVHWLYRQMRERSLLPLSDALAEAAYPLAEIYTNNLFMTYDGGRDFQIKHNVNVQQDMKMPVIYSVRSRSAYDRASYMIGANHTFRQHG